MVSGPTRDYTESNRKVVGRVMKVLRLPWRQLELAKLFEQVSSRSELNFRRVSEKVCKKWLDRQATRIRVNLKQGLRN